MEAQVQSCKNPLWKKILFAFVIVLVIALIVVTVIVLRSCASVEGMLHKRAAILSKGSKPAEGMKAAIVSRGSRPEGMSCGMHKSPEAQMEKKQNSYENMTQKAMKENYEYFALCSPDNSVEGMDNKEDSEPANNKFDSYNDFMTSWAIDNKVIENHLMFVRDRRGLGPEGEFVTGRTYSPDSHDSYDPIPWTGIRGRPHAPADLQCNPTQVPDIDTNLYRKNRPYCFWT